MWIIFCQFSIPVKFWVQFSHKEAKVSFLVICDEFFLKVLCKCKFLDQTPGLTSDWGNTIPVITDHCHCQRYFNSISKSRWTHVHVVHLLCISSYLTSAYTTIFLLLPAYSNNGMISSRSYLQHFGMSALSSRCSLFLFMSLLNQVSPLSLFLMLF